MTIVISVARPVAPDVQGAEGYLADGGFLAWKLEVVHRPREQHEGVVRRHLPPVAVFAHVEEVLAQAPGVVPERSEKCS